MYTPRNERCLTNKMNCWKMYMLIMDILIPATVVLASFDVHDTCPDVTMTSCPYVTLATGEVVQYTPKAIPPDLDWLISDLPSDLQITDDVKHFYCAEPACLSNPCLHGGTCEESETGFICICPDGYHGTTCDHVAFIHSLKLVGGNENEGRLLFSSRSSRNSHLRVDQSRWKMNSSELACKYLGFEGVYATVSGAYYNASSLDAGSEAVAVICPTNATNITDCWHDETQVDRIEESIGIVCCPVNLCNISGKPLGLESGDLPDSALMASTCWSGALCSQNARLNGPQSWASQGNQNEWLQVQFEASAVVTAITTQGRFDLDQWVTSYSLSSSANNMDWTDYFNVYSGLIEVFAGNYDRNTYVTYILVTPMVGRSFRINPKTFSDHVSLRLELYGYGPLTDDIASINRDVRLGCTPPVRGVALGVEDGTIPDSRMTSSSIWDSGHEAYRGRLNHQRGIGFVGAWASATTDPHKWIMVDLGEVMVVTGAITQGRAENNYLQCVTSLRISYSINDSDWIFALDDQCGMRKMYAGNFDQHSYVYIIFPRPVAARYVRLHPLTFIDHSSMRLEILGIK